jgi:hypothetical protein
MTVTRGTKNKSALALCNKKLMGPLQLELFWAGAHDPPGADGNDAPSNRNRRSRRPRHGT